MNDETRPHDADKDFGAYHPAGTCRTGSADDPGSVVGVDCSVHGIEGLSVADASVMPTVPRGNTNIPVTMIAEHAAERITRNMSEAKHPTSVFRSPDEQ